MSDSEFFAEHGYLIKERLFSDADLDRIQVALDELTDLATRAPEDSDRFKFSIFGHGGDRRQVQQVADPHEFGGAFIALGRDPRILDLVEELLGPNVLLYYSMLMMKPPAGGAASPWHQDLAFYTHDQHQPDERDDGTDTLPAVGPELGDHRLAPAAGEDARRVDAQEEDQAQEQQGHVGMPRVA